MAAANPAPVTAMLPNPANNVRGDVILDAGESAVTAMTFIQWTPVPAAANQPARVALSSHQMLRIFAPR